MQIRRAIPSDKKELSKLLRAFNTYSQQVSSEKQNRFRKFIDPLKWSEETAEKYLSLYIVFVADDDGSLKGYICGEIKEIKYRYFNKEGYVEHWFVEESSQSQGIGKKLFTLLTDEFKKAGCTHIGLDTNIENNKAINIYEEMGLIKRLVTFYKPLIDIN